MLICGFLRDSRGDKRHWNTPQMLSRPFNVMTLGTNCQSRAEPDSHSPTENMHTFGLLENFQPGADSIFSSATHNTLSAFVHQCHSDVNETDLTEGAETFIGLLILIQCSWRLWRALSCLLGGSLTWPQQDTMRYKCSYWRGKKTPDVAYSLYISILGSCERITASSQILSQTD